MKNLILTLSMVVMFGLSMPVFGAQMYIAQEGNIVFAPLTPTAGYGSEVSDNLIDIYIHMPFSPALTAVGFNAFPADTDYKFRFGLIQEGDYTGTSADWDSILGMEVVYTSGTAGKAYTVVNGVMDTDNAVTITDLLGGA
ncbi:unnamed protein product, partial [marine sediment metagenome]